MASRAAGSYEGTEGIITGYVLKLVRESIGLSQERLAEALSVDPHTIQGWESGRRPLMATQVRVFVDLCQRLTLLGARPELVESLDTAISADHLLTYCLDAGDAVTPSEHPLSRWVLTRRVSHMVRWPLTGPTNALQRSPIERQSSPRRGLGSARPFLLWCIDRARGAVCRSGKRSPTMIRCATPATRSASPTGSRLSRMPSASVGQPAMSRRMMLGGVRTEGHAFAGAALGQVDGDLGPRDSGYDDEHVLANVRMALR
jgi:transcriptional regulator with XRE-family HTH domain